MIYLDHAAATPLTTKALEAMLPYFSQDFFNPSAPYLPAKHVREAYESAKNTIAHAIGAKGADLVITAGATESINLAFTTCATAPTPSAASSYTTSTTPAASGASVLPIRPTSWPPRILTLPTEHAAVLEAARPYGVEFVNVDRHGLIDLADLRRRLLDGVADDIMLVSISLANNELGTIQPLSEIAEIIRSARQHRLQRGTTMPLYLHSDASQAVNLLNLNVARLGVDLMTLNAAKCGGPKGVGALYVARGVELRPLSLGGGQEMGLRSGTENVPGVIGFATAISEAQSHLSHNLKQYQEMAYVLRRELAHTFIVSQDSEKVNSKINPKGIFSKKRAAKSLQPLENTGAEDGPVAKIEARVTDATSGDAMTPQIPQPIFLGDPKHRLASFIPVCFPGIDAERLIYRLEDAGILVSTGAACAANKGTKSHVLAAIGLSDAEIAGSLRISLGSTNDLSQIERAATLIRQAVLAEYQRQGYRIPLESIDPSLAPSNSSRLKNDTSAKLPRRQELPSGGQHA